MAWGKRRSTMRRSRGTFDINDEKRVKHTKIGVWDLYEEQLSQSLLISSLPGIEALEDYLRGFQNVSYVWMMVKDIASIRGCWLLLVLYAAVDIVSSLIPALALWWYSGQMLKIVETAVETRTVDKETLFRVATGRIGCTLASRLLSHLAQRLQVPLNKRIKQFYSQKIFHARARLDCPTFDDPVVQRQLEAASSGSSRSSVAWSTFNSVLKLVSTALSLASQVSVLLGVVRNQQDGPLLAALSVSQMLIPHLSRPTSLLGGVWAATTRNEDFIRMQGMKHVVDNPAHRQELVAGDLGRHMESEYEEAAARVGDEAGDFFDVRNERRSRLGISFLEEPLKELPQIVFTLRAAQYPASIPVSIASLNLIQQTVSSFSHRLFVFFANSGSIVDHLDALRKLYELSNIKNQITDGTTPFPEDENTLHIGIDIEFRNVSFLYPGATNYALRNISFKIGRGQLCVLVGSNGSGKSTILKLITRLYDCTEGEILVDGKNIKTYRSTDLRRAMSVLFQDFTIWPLSISENIGIGDPANARNQDKIEEAAKLGGAHEFIMRLPEGYGTYLDRPVRDYYTALPEGTKTIFGREVDYGRIRGMGGMSSTTSINLSGGQLQRIALSRSFMRSVLSDCPVGLLLFDEPSAALDPMAEYDLFERLRQLRGNKTMVFSSHRFGNLTRHADLILYMDDATVVEAGTHDELQHAGGEYARLWGLQAQAFA